MKDSFKHIFSIGSVTLINDLMRGINRICIVILLLLWITPFFVQAQHLDNRKRLDSFHRARTTSGATILKVLANSYNVTGGGAYCSGGSGVAVGLSGSEIDTTYQLQLNGTNTGSPVIGTGGSINFGLQTAAGTYTVVAITGSGPMLMNGAATVTINPLPTPTAGSNTPQCAGSTLNLTATGGSTYNWTGPNGFNSTSATPSITNVTTAASGTYTVVVTDGNGCSATTNTTVTINALPTPTANSNTPQCAGSTLNLTATGGATYNWTGPNGFISSQQNPMIFNVTTAASGIYTVIVTDGNGCSATTNTTVTINALPTPTAGSNTPQCVGSTLNLTANGGTIYSWTAPNGFASNQQNPVITNVTTAAAVTYTVTVTDGNGCLATASTTVTINTLPVATASSNTPQCVGSTLNLAATGGTTYNWTGPNGFTSNTQNPSIAGVTTAASGVYTVVVTDGNGCSATTTTNVTINALPTPTASSNTPQCTGSTLNLTATGGTTYNWTGPNGFTSNTQNPSIAGVTTAASGVYTVVVTDGNGCSGTTTTNVTINALPTPTASSNTPQCASVTLNLTATGGTNYSWTGPNGFISSSATPSITNVTTAASGIYTVVVTNGNGCSATTTANVTINALPTPTASSNTPQCASGTLNLTVTGGTNYSWTGPNGFTSSSATPSITNVTTAASGIYTVVVTNGNGCSATTTANVTINALPTPTASSNTPQCVGSTLNLTATGGTTYSWTGPNGFTSNTQNPSIAGVTTAASGVYTVVVTDGNGCSGTTTTNVTINALPTPTASSNTPQCASGTLNLTATGGTNYSWTGPNGFTSSSATPSITNVTTAASGIYTVVVTNGNGCSATTTANVTINALPTPTASSNTPQCASGTLNLTATGGTNYSWTGPNGFTSSSATPSITNVTTAASGIYTVVVTNGNGCSATTTTNVTINALPTPTASSNTPQCVGSTLNLAATGGTTYNWTGPNGFTSNTQNPSIAGVTTAASGVYTVVVTDGNGCSATTTTNVTINALPTPTASSNTPQCASGTLNLTVTGGTNYSWTGPNGFTSSSATPSITNVTTAASGIYTVVVTNGNGCSATTTTNVTINALPTPTASSNTPQCTGSSLNLTASGGSTYNWTGPNGFTSNTQNPSIAGVTTAASGVYTVVVTDGNGCSATTTTNVTINALPTPTASSNTPQCTGSTLNLTATGGTTYSWTGPNGFNSNQQNPSITSVTTAAAGTYTVTVTNANGCTSITTTNVTITALPTATISYIGAPFCTTVSAAQNVTLTGTGAFNGGTYSVAPSGLSINSTTGAITPSTSTPGAYTVTYTIAATGGCPVVTATANVTITALPTATISYAGTPFCTTVNTASVTLTGTGAYNGGTYSAAPSGLTINTTTGVITPSSSTAGTYTITYTTPASGGCAAVNSTTSVTITAAPTASLSYAGTPFCRSISTAQSATLTGTGAYTGGTYTAAPAGLSITPSTGAITPSTSTAGTYTVTYTTPVSGGCAAVTTTATVVITAVPTATISYAGTPFCTTVGSAPVTLSGTGAYTGGTFGAPAGLTINSSTGEITPSSSTPGTYTITYNIPASGGCAAVNATTSVTITAAPTASLSYAGTPFCRSVSTAQAATLTGTGAYTGGTYSAAPSGLTINTSTGAITPSSSTAGTYTVTYTRAASGGCAAISTTATVVITAVPTATISYAGTPFCTTVGSAPVTLSGTGAYTGGTFGAPAGLTINSSTGEITPSSSTPGTYTITYNIPASGGCATVNVTTSVTITAQPTVNLTYAGNPFCRSVSTAQAATLTGTGAYTGGTYSAAPSGLTINTSTGAITPSSSTAGTYTVTYTRAASGGCAAISTTATVVITAVPTATISYAGTPFCTTVGSAPVTLSGTGAYTGGTFGAPAGLTINSSTGEITPSSSTPGTYTITYNIPASGGCATVNVTTSVTITAQPTVNLTYAGNPFCRSVSTAQSATLTGTGAYTGGTYSAAPSGLTINTSTGAITPSSSTAGTYTVTYTRAASGGCAAISTTASVTITAVPTATISYAGTPFCTTVNTASVTLTGTGAYSGGTYSTAPSGLTINTTTGVITPSSSTAGTYTITYTTPASGGCAAVNATTSVTITTAPTASLSYAGTPFCRSVSTAQAATLTGTGAYTGGTYSAAPSGLTINTSTGAITPSSSTAGAYTVTYTRAASGGCAAITTTASITITTAPTAAISYPATSFCTSVSSPQAVTLIGTGAYTGGTYSVSPLGLSINSTTGTISPSISTTGTYTVTYTVPASGGCAAVTATTGMIINSTPTISVSPSSATICSGNSTILTASGGASYTWNPSTGLSTTSGATVTASPTTTTTYTVTGTAANGCTNTATVTITVNPSPAGGTIAPAVTSACTGSNSGTLTLSGNTGTIIRWESSTNGGGTWASIANTSNTQSYSNLSQTTIYRAVVQNGGCTSYSSNGVVSVTPAYPPTGATANPAEICLGDSSTLSATGTDLPSSWSGVEDFNSASLDNSGGWSATENGLPHNIQASADNEQNTPFNLTNPKVFNGMLYNSGDPKFAIAAGTGTTTMVTPVFNTIGMSTAVFSFWQAFNINAGTTISVEISTDGGSTFQSVPLLQYTGPATLGTPDNGFVQTNIDLTNYLGLSNLKIRFNYQGSAGSNWAIDNAGMVVPAVPLTYNWTLTNPSGVQSPYYLNTTTGQSVKASPTAPGTYTYTVSTTYGGCPGGSANVAVVVKPLPVCDITGNNSVCPASTNTYSGPNISGYSYQWSISGSGTISGSSTGQTVTVVAGGRCGTYTLSLRTTLNGCQSSTACNFTVNIVDTQAPVITLTASTSVPCNPTAANIVAAFGTATVADNCTTGLTATFTDGVEQGTGCIRTVTRTWTVTDSCGNTGTATQTVSFTRDTQAPQFVGVPANITIQCDNIPAAPVVTANDNCSPSVAVTYAEAVSVVEGCGTITRTWTTTDLCGNTATATQVLTVVDNTAPIITGVPANATVQCGNLIEAGFAVTATDNCDPTITVNFSETNNVVEGCGTITRTWTATDACGNTTTATQVLTVVDNTPPVAPAPASQSFQCLADVPAPGTLTATDNCSGNITATGVDVQVAKACGYTITRTWTFTDACNNTSSVSQIINVEDSIPPVITCPPAQVFCAVNSNTYTIPPATASDNCNGTLNFTYQITGATTRSGTGNDASGVFNVGVSTITWTVTDACGNTSTCTTTVTVNPRPAPIIFHN
ncbi:hypothetical protein FAM09_30360 [Niastella caeni]|uniref:HYR domain-containing protein n=1 Tax=Niastella caeni TaxID=2569763 RepID=A0A4S8H6M2_9BACT|nr:hypothetical protein [Niastella caeni]THU30207.1 hypothetical protein FAM09_30360 [Niastella caeni]